MNVTEWSTLTGALKKCLNSSGTLYYDYDGRLNGIISRYAPANCDVFDHPKVQDYICNDSKESIAAIDRWVKVQQQTENTCIVTHAQLELERSDESAKFEIQARLGTEGKMLVQGVHTVTDMCEFPDWQEDRRVQAKALFDIGVRAMDVFLEKPTALVLFPNITISDNRVFGGFYGSPWSTFNARTLKAKFRNMNGHFQIHVCTVNKSGGLYYTEHDSCKVGVLFTYVNPW